MLTTIMGKKAVVIFFDMEKTSELANPRAILTALASKGVGGKLLHWTQDFLTGRRVRVRFQDHLTQYITLQNGMPQGSFLSSHLFNTLIEELASLVLLVGTKVFCYANDVAIVFTGLHHLQKA